VNTAGFKFDYLEGDFHKLLGDAHLAVVQHKSQRRPNITAHNLTLYHYTSVANFIQIIETQELWSTAVASMNDKSEFLHSLTYLRNAITARLSSPTTVDLHCLLDVLLREIKDTKTAAGSGQFITCFSEERDDLSQWRAYGGDQGGIALQFSFSNLVDHCKAAPVLLLPVVYRKSVKANIMADVITRLETVFTKGLTATPGSSNFTTHKRTRFCEDFAKAWVASGIWALGAMYKHQGFRNEHEWRLAYSLNSAGAKQLVFNQRATITTTHWPCSLPALTGIVVGPTNDRNLMKYVVGDLLAKKGYPSNSIPIRYSTTPFRPSR
jgi:hypothetical protein